MNIAEILKNAPKGTKLYSPIYGDVQFWRVDNNNGITIHWACDTASGGYNSAYFQQDGRIGENGECMLFPSKEQRDWSQFRILRVFKPFDKVVVRDTNEWHIDLFERYNPEENLFYCLQSCWRECLPYNEHTEKLIGTTDDFMG